MNDDELFEWLHQRLLLFIQINLKYQIQNLIKRIQIIDHQQLNIKNISVTTKDILIAAKAIQYWCSKGFDKNLIFNTKILDSGIQMINQILIVMAGIQLRINPKMVDDIIRLIYDKEDKQKLLEQLQQAEQKQVSLKVTNSPKILKAKVEQKDPGLFGNILTALRCWDKKQK